MFSNYKMSSIEKIFAREIIDSRGTPTVEVEIHLEDICSTASVPQVLQQVLLKLIELRDNDKKRFFERSI